MINTDKEINKGKSNDTFCRRVSIKLKKNEQLNLTNWDGRIVLSLSMNIWIICYASIGKTEIVLLLGKDSRYICWNGLESEQINGLKKSWRFEDDTGFSQF